MKHWLYVGSFVGGLVLMCFAIRLDEWPGLPLALVGIGVACLSVLAWGREIQS